MTHPDQAGVLFDIDGTLLDSTYHHALAWLRAFRAHGHHEVSAAEVHRAIGLGDDQLVPHVLGHDDEALADAHSEEYRELREEVQTLPQTEQLLARCAEAGLRVVLASSGKKADLDWMLPRIGGADHLAGCVTSEDVDATKPAPDLLQTAADRYGLNPNNAVTVGDSVWDGKAAKEAGIRFVGVLSGGASEAELTDAGAVEVYRDVADLLEHFDSSLLATL